MGGMVCRIERERSTRTKDKVDQGGVVARAEAVLSSGHMSRIVARRQERVTVD